MKFYLNIANVKHKSNTVDASIKEFNTLEAAIHEFSKHRKMFGNNDSKVIFDSKHRLSECFITTSGANVSYKIKTSIMGKEYLDYKFKVPVKYVAGRRFIQTDPEYGLCDEKFDILYTNYKSAVKSLEVILNKMYETEYYDKFFSNDLTN